MDELERQEVLVFNSALALASRAERAAYLDQACAGDAALRKRVEALLSIQSQADNFFDGAEGDRGELPGALPDPGTIDSVAGTRDADPAFGVDGLTEKAGDSIGRFQILEKIGEGGFAVVYLAEQREPVRRSVALKIIKLGMDTRQVIARFEAERQALALMDHPNIAKVFDAGASGSGRPYFVMELVRGIPITQYCDENSLPTAKRLELFAQVCRAIQHAHQKGIIHRDIKPSNLLVTLHDGVPVPKVIDFGIAKATQQALTEKTVFTQFHQFIGTPAYMSPEQAELSGVDIDTRSDIYSLGVLLYELLTGKTPFDGQELLAAGLESMRRTIREQEPVRPSTRLTTMAGPERTRVAHQRQAEPPKLVHLLRGDLDWMVMKALEKDRKRRYETANGLAQDIQRHLDNEPIAARPPSNLYRLQKLARRNKGAVAAVTAIAFLLVLGVVVSTWQAYRATRAVTEQKRALAGEAAQLRRAEQNLYAADMKQAQQFVKDDNLIDALSLLNKHRPTATETNDIRGFEWRFLWQQCQGDDHTLMPTLNDMVWWLEYSPDGIYLAAASSGGVTVFEVASKRVVARFEDSGDPIGEGLSAIFTAGGKTLITANQQEVKFFETTHWTEQFRLTNAASPISLSRDETTLATMQPQSTNEFSWWNGVKIWNLRTREVSFTLTNVYGPPVLSPDGQRLAIYTPEGIKLWPIAVPGASPILLKGSLNIFGGLNDYSPHRKSVAYSPDGRLVAAGPCLGNLAVMLWDSATGERLDDDKLTGHTSCVGAVAFSRDGHYLVSGGLDDTIRIWDVITRKAHRKVLGNLGEVWSVAFAPDGESLASGGGGVSVRIWPVNFKPQSQEEDFKDRWYPRWISTNGQEVVTSGAERLEFWNTITHQVAHVIPRPNTPQPPPQSSLLVSPDGQMVFAGYPDGVLRFASFAAGDIVALGGAHAGKVDCLAASPDSKMLVSASRDARLCWWELPSMQGIRSNHVASALTGLGFSPDGKTLVGGTEDLRLCWWESGSGQLIASSALLPQAINEVVFSPDGKTLATVANRQVRLWDVATRTLRPGSMATFETVAFSPDSRKLVAAGPNLWDASDGKLLGGFAGHKQIVFSVIFSPDGRNVVSASHDGTVRLWSVETQQELLTWSRAGTTFYHPMFSADGRTLVAGSLTPDAGGVRVWHAPSFAEIEAKEKAGLQNQ